MRVKLEALVEAAARAREDRGKLEAKLADDGDYGHLPKVNRERLLGPRPTWADYVGELHHARDLTGPVNLTHASASQAFGSARHMRAVAMRILEIADEIDPVEVGG